MTSFHFSTPLILMFSMVFGKTHNSGGKISPAQESMDVKHYTISLRVDPYKKTIVGQVTILFQLLQETDQIEIDLIDKYYVSGATINGTSLAYEHNNNAVLINNYGLGLFVDHELVIKYGGRPPEAKNPPWDGGFTWSKDKQGMAWLGVSCQSNGAHIWFPCVEHPSDKVEGAEIDIAVPDPLMVVSNGLLLSKQKEKDRWTRWHWKTSYPISAYNINFTIGGFELLRKNGYVLDKPIKMEYYVLPEMVSGGTQLLEEAEKHLNFYASIFGQYPWIDEKFGIVHTPYLGMEHQTINAYGNKYKKTKLGYDFILFHEMGHEWFGNFISVKDWKDFWIHEGFVTYAEAMYVEKNHGLEIAKAFVKERFVPNINNSKPLVPAVSSTSGDVAGNDVYYKGAYVLHMLRYLIGKQILWGSLKEFVNMPKDLKGNQTTTKEFISLINENSGRNLDWFFSRYLFSKELPTLEVVEKTYKNKKFIDMRWVDTGFKMPVEISYESFDGARQKKLEINNKQKRIVIPVNSDLKIDPNGWVLCNIITSTE